MAQNIITINRGDSYDFTILITENSDSDEFYMLNEDDAVYLGIMPPHFRFEDAFIKKIYFAKDQGKDGNIIASIKPEDTIDLIPGVYYYTVKLRQHIGSDQENVLTVINKTKFVIND